MWRVFWHFLAQQQYWLRHLSQNYSTNRRRTCQRGRIIVAATTSDQSQWVWHWRLIFNTLARRLRCVCVWVWRWRVKLCEYFSHFFWFYFQICVFNLRSLRLANVCQTDLPFRHIRHQHKQTFQSTSIIRVDVNVKRVTSLWEEVMVAAKVWWGNLTCWTPPFPLRALRSFIGTHLFGHVWARALLQLIDMLRAISFLLFCFVRCDNYALLWHNINCRCFISWRLHSFDLCDKFQNNKTFKK